MAATSVTSHTPPALAPRRRPKERPAELLKAALGVFASKGYAATRLDDIALKAGVSKGTIYLYFANKEALFMAAIEAGITPLVEAVEALSLDEERPSPERLRAFMLSWWSRIGDTPLSALPRLLVAEGNNFPKAAQWFHDEIVTRVQRALARLIETGIARGELRAVEPMVAARILFAPMFAYLVWRETFGQTLCHLPPPEQFFGLAADLLLAGLVRP
ncbi:MAG: TetR/AcrR family transcriptional regulator [Rhodocyclaceae bacterium]|nr:TetR/AcrR family transcriptional regulator [Rhodocyclaceae bacterium]